MSRTGNGALRLAVAALLIAALLPLAAEAEVKTRLRADGSIEIYNEGGGVDLGIGSSKPLVLRAVPNMDWSVWIAQHAGAAGLDERLVQAVIQVESGYNPRAVSRKGAMGLMQLMPGTARLLSVSDPFSPEQNIRGGVTYLRQMLDKFGRLELALAAYNAGPGAVERHRGVPPYADTRDYVRRVMGLYQGGSWFGITISASGGGTVRPNGLVQNDAGGSLLQQALASGSLRRSRPTPAAPPAPRPAPTTTLVRATPPAAPAPANAVPLPEPAEPLAVPAALPATAGPAPAPATPITGG